jgi:hypothetical protein
MLISSFSVLLCDQLVSAKRALNQVLEPTNLILLAFERQRLHSARYPAAARRSAEVRGLILGTGLLTGMKADRQGFTAPRD